jgi:hypothetical protein
VMDKVGAFGLSHHQSPSTAAYDSLPTDFSNSSQACSPYLPFHSE